MKTLVIGDIHGMLPELKALIASVGPVDQIISCGDLIDRGPHSYETIKFCQSNNIQVCLGNHELMAIDAISRWLDPKPTPFKRMELLDSDWFANKGSQVFESIPSTHLQSVLDYFKSLPIFIKTNYTVNSLPVIISHSLVTRQLSNFDTPIYYDSPQALELVWARQLPRESKFFNIHGHTPTDYFSDIKTPQPMQSNFHINLDTGACYDSPTRGILTGITLPDMKFHYQAKL